MQPGAMQPGARPPLARRLLRGLLRHAVRTTAWTYVVVAVLLLVARYATGDRFWPVLVATHLSYAWLAPAPLVLAYAALRRAPRMGALALAPVIALAVDCGPWLAPARATPPPDERAELRVLTWNLGFRLARVDLVADEIRRLDPDLVLLQEPTQEVHAQLVRRLGAEYPHHGFGAAERPIRAKAWLSRLPLERAEVATRVTGAGGARLGVTEARAEVVLAFDGAPLHVDSVHASAMLAKLGRAWWEAPGYVALARRAAARGSSLVVGDVNTTERSPLYRDIVDAGVRDAWREAGAGPGFGFPSTRRHHWLKTPPLVRIDYLFHTPDLECTRVELGDGEGADHRPLLGVFRRAAPPAR